MRSNRMQVHRSNRTERLVDALSEVVSQPCGSPFAAETIVVQGRGMERWLAMSLAARFGVWANPDFPFPRAFIERALIAGLADSSVPEGQDATTYPSPLELRFHVARAIWPLRDQTDESGVLAQVQGYLSRGSDCGRSMALAERVARLFDQYVVYRPEMCLTWQAQAKSPKKAIPRGTASTPGQLGLQLDATPDEWQAELFRESFAPFFDAHVGKRASLLLQKLQSETEREETLARLRAALPSRVSFFGISSLPPLYMTLLRAISDAITVHLFVLSPSQEFWGEIRSRREILRTLHRQKVDPRRTADELHLEEGNPLLASFGRLGRDFQQVLELTGDYVDGPRDLYVEPAPVHTLGALQHDVLRLVDRRDEKTLTFSAQDDSFEVHSCHSPMREMQVLRDRLLALLNSGEGDDAITPADIVVMAPQIEAYAPYIEAVFGSAEPPLPFHIADRGARGTLEVVSAVLFVLELIQGRLPASAVIDLLQRDVVRARLGLSEDRLERVQTWIARTNTRWALDGAHRSDEGQPPLAQNSWSLGVDRLFLGFATGESDALVQGLFPFDDVEAADTESLGALADLIDVLATLRAAATGELSVAAFQALVEGLLEKLIESSAETHTQIDMVRSAVAELNRQCEAASFDAPLDTRTWTRLLEGQLNDRSASRGFLSGGITFCQLVPMRSIPFKVVALVGMSDESFPRLQRPLGFDLIARRPKVGDHISRDDDRHLFLESVLSARAHLLITYVGQDVQDGSHRPPSVVVSELLDYLDEAVRYERPNGQVTSARDALVLHHPLQAFSEAYFRAPSSKFFSYDARYRDVAEALQQRSQPSTLHLTSTERFGLGQPKDESATVVELDDLIRFVEHPARFFVQQVMKLRLDSSGAEVQDREPMELNALEEWHIGTRLLNLLARGLSFEDAYAHVAAEGMLPPGELGRSLFDKLAPSAHEIHRVTTRRIAESEAGVQRTCRVDLTVGEASLKGVVGDVWGARRISSEYGRAPGRRELRAWVQHLAWSASDEGAGSSFFVGKSGSEGASDEVIFRPVDDPHAHLKVLLELYQLGQQAPLPFFPKTARAFVESLLSGKDDALDKARSSARKCFQPGSFGSTPGEAEDPYNAKVFETEDPLGARFNEQLGFEQVAEAIYAPLFEHTSHGDEA